MNRLKYLALLLIFPFIYVACNEDDDSSVMDEEYSAGGAIVNIKVVDSETQQAINNVSLRQTTLRISENTSTDGTVAITFDEAPRAITELVLSHDDYETYTTSIAIGEVYAKDTKEVEVVIELDKKSIKYLVSFTVYDEDTFDPIEGILILGLETGSEATNIDGVANVYVPGNGDYTLTLSHEYYEEATITFTMDGIGLPGETIMMDLGVVYMAPRTDIIIIDLTGTWDVQTVNASREDRGDMGKIVMTKEEYMATDWEAAGGWDRRSEFGGLDFEYIIAAGGQGDYRYPLCFNLLYEESPDEEGAYKIEVMAFLELFNANYIEDNKSYYKPSTGTLVFDFYFFEAWRGYDYTIWDCYIFTNQQK